MFSRKPLKINNYFKIQDYKPPFNLPLKFRANLNYFSFCKLKSRDNLPRLPVCTARPSTDKDCDAAGVFFVCGTHRPIRIRRAP